MSTINTISRLPQHHIRESKYEQYRLHKNTDPVLHPFQQAKEYKRALNAAKLERMFAKPFLGSLGNGHIEGVYTLARDGDSVVDHGTIYGGFPGELTRIASGSADGQISIWNTALQRQTFSFQHKAFVKGLVFVPRGLSAGLSTNLEYEDSLLLSGGDDQQVKLWSTKQVDSPLQTWTIDAGITCLDHHKSRELFASSSTESIVLWSLHNSAPIQTFKWGTDTTYSIRFNPAHVDLLAGTSADRSITLYDLRLNTPTSKTILQMKSNSIAWNPMEPFYFAAACEDHRAYLFDIRYLKKPINVLVGHVGAVMDIDYSPTGMELVTAGYDKLIKLWNIREGSGTARDTYHTSRMQRVHCVRFTGDAKFVLSGSDDGNVRLWRTKADERLGIKSERQQIALNYSEALKQKYSNLPEVERILKHRQLPKVIKSMSRTEREIRDSVKRKQERQRKHSKKDQKVPLPNIRTDAVVKTLF